MPRLRLVVLGSAAGGGAPQWNCTCPVCALAWAGDPRVRRRTQSSIAVTADGEAWGLVNCSPDVLAQIAATPALQPPAAVPEPGASPGRRASPIRGVLLTNGDVDHVAGLLSLRESQPFTLHATPEIHAVLRGNPMFDVLNPAFVARREVALGGTATLAPGVEARVFAVPGKLPLYLEGAAPEVGAEGEATVGVEIMAGGASAYYVPGCARLSEALAERLRGADLMLFDGTLFSDDEMIAAGVGVKTGRRMGHMPMTGPGGTLQAFAGLGIARKLFVHMNNTNPALVDGSPERAEVEAAGWEVAHDGLELTL